MYSKPDLDSMVLPLLEIFKNDFEHYEPYVPLSEGDEEGYAKKSEEEEETEEELEETEEDEEEETDEEVEDDKGYDYQLGDILEIYYYNNLTNMDYEYDYTDISSSCTINFPGLINGKRFFKGVQGRFKSNWFKPDNYDLNEMKNIIRFFIEDISYSEDGTQLSNKGIDVLLDEEYQFSFTHMRRSEILKEMIKTAGLKPEVDAEGLVDDIIDYTNISGSGDSGGDASGAPNISAMVKEATKGKSGDRAKAEAIYKAMVDHLTYSFYECSKYPSTNEGADQAWQAGAVNCADSAKIGRVAYTAAGLKAHVTWSPGHFWCTVTIDGQEVASDVTANSGQHCSRSLGEICCGYSGGDNQGDWPSC